MRRQCLPVEQLHTWASFNGVQLHAASITGRVEDEAVDKGAGLIATHRVSDQGSLLSVPSDLILSKERVEEVATVDRHLRDVLTAASELSEKPRGAILIFLILQITHASPDTEGEKIGVTSPFTDYVKFLPEEMLLPTFYSQAERDLLTGTSLKDALDQKLASMEKEFAYLRESTQSIAWCQRHWWDEETGHLTLEDWKQVDAMYRSRALELPGFGDAMAPLIDMANHASEGNCTARFEVNQDSSVLLLLREGKTLEQDEEITIMYGAGGACEMIFSYGFLESGATTAREVFLNLDIPSDDPLRLAKKTMAREVPGVRLYMNQEGSVGWESKFVWWACVNEEDGLDFEVLQTTDGSRELAATWKKKELESSNLEFTLSSDEMAKVFELRAIVTLQQRLEQQGAALEGSEERYETGFGEDSVRDEVWEMIGRLRSLELDLLSRVFEDLEDKKARLTKLAVVQRYLQPGGPEDDFS